LKPDAPGRRRSREVPVLSDVLNPRRLFRLPHAAGQPDTRLEANSLGRSSNPLQITLATKPVRVAHEHSPVLVRHPRLAKGPARFFANLTKHDFQRGREIVGRRQLPCDRSKQTELLFTFLALLFRALRR